MFADAPERTVAARKGRSFAGQITTSAPVALGALAVLATGVLALAALDLGPLSAHMAQHIALMNVLAPAGAILVSARVGAASVGARRASAGDVWLAAAAQLLLLWSWHVPSLQAWGMASVLGLVVMHASLFLAALCFWMTVLNLAAARRWHAIFALLITGKVACLLGSLLIFAPRPLYAASSSHLHHLEHTAAPLPLADQQLAGLLMIVACPLSYLLAGVGLAAQIMRDLGRTASTPSDRHVPSPMGR